MFLLVSLFTSLAFSHFKYIYCQPDPSTRIQHFPFVTFNPWIQIASSNILFIIHHRFPWSSFFFLLTVGKFQLTFYNYVKRNARSFSANHRQSSLTNQSDTAPGSIENTRSGTAVKNIGGNCVGSDQSSTLLNFPCILVHYDCHWPLQVAQEQNIFVGKNQILIEYIKYFCKICRSLWQ